MKKVITIDPVTRISGFLEIKAQVEEGTIVNANSSGLLFRGFEKMLRGRSPLDAIYFTERVCGICSAAHAITSTLALESALKVQVSLNDNYIRDIMHGFEIMQNHLRHFYLLSMPDYAKISSIRLVGENQYSDYRFPKEINQKIEKHYVESIDFSRLAHEGLATLGGKAPHTHGIFVGGVTVDIDSYKLEKVKSIIRKITDFVSNVMMEDIELLSNYYFDYFQKGESYSNFMSYGLFDKYEEPDITYVKPGIMRNGVKYNFEPDGISEQIHYTWYVKDQNLDEVDLSKPDAYTFIKAPRYAGLPMEVGPLARMIISGEYTHGNSCMDRIIARVLETEKILKVMSNLADRVEIKPNNQKIYEIPDKAYGAGFIDTSRGSLAHWTQIENKVINNYNIITPSGWNLSPKDMLNVPGTVERALIGTKLDNINEPVEIGRIVRSYDPCVSCATHVIGGGRDKEVVEILV